MSMYDLLIKGGQCVLPDQNGQLSIQNLDVAVKNGSISEIGEIDESRAEKVFKAQGLHVLPGLIDTQVHFREPGNEHKEDLASGTRAAAAGGITAVFEMPNTKPATVSAIDLIDKVNRAKGRAWCDFAFYMGAAPENADRLDELENTPGCCGVKVFMGSSTGSLLVDDVAVLQRALSSGKKRVAVHCEDEGRLKERKHFAKDHVRTHPIWRDEETAFLATKKLLELADKTGRPVHVLHVTTKQEMELLKVSKHLCSVEVTPQHLTLVAPDCYEQIGTRAQMNPPIRTADHREALWQALKDGTVDVIGSDHAPHTLEEKSADYPNTPSGMPGVQTTIPLLLNHINEGRLKLEDLVRLMAENPIKLFHMKDRGRIEVGRLANFTIVDLDKEHTLLDKDMETKSGWTPFHGMKIKGQVTATILHGGVVMRDGQILGSPLGQTIEFD